MKTNQFQQHPGAYQYKKSFKLSKSQHRIWSCLISKQIEHQMSFKSASRSSSMSRTANRPFPKSKFLIILYESYGPFYMEYSPYHMVHSTVDLKAPCIASSSSDNLSGSESCAGLFRVISNMHQCVIIHYGL